MLGIVFRPSQCSKCGFDVVKFVWLCWQASDLDKAGRETGLKGGAEGLPGPARLRHCQSTHSFLQCMRNYHRRSSLRHHMVSIPRCLCLISRSRSRSGFAGFSPSWVKAALLMLARLHSLLEAWLEKNLLLSSFWLLADFMYLFIFVDVILRVLVFCWLSARSCLSSWRRPLSLPHGLLHTQFPSSWLTSPRPAMWRGLQSNPAKSHIM